MMSLTVRFAEHTTHILSFRHEITTLLEAERTKTVISFARVIIVIVLILLTVINC